MSHSPFARLRQRIRLDRRNGWLGGVCAGIAEAFRTDPAFVRVAFVLGLLFLTKLTIALYLVAWLLLDEDTSLRRS